MKTSGTIIIIFLVAFLLNSCEKAEIQTANPNIAVVEGYLIPGQAASVKIFRQLIFGKDSVAKNLNDLTVTLKKITSKDTVREVLKLIGDTAYTSQSLVSADTSYSIEFQYNKKLVSSETLIPSKPINFKLSVDSIIVEAFTPGSGRPPTFDQEGITATWDNTANEYYLVFIKNIETSPALIDTSTDTNRPPRFFRNQPEQTNSANIRADRFTYYGRHQVILIHLYADYAALYNNNGTTSLNLTPPPTNVTNGLGIFTGINTDTLILKVMK